MKDFDFFSSSQSAQSLLFIAEAGIYVVYNGKFVYVSHLFEQLSGYKANELIGTYSLNLVHPDDREMVREQAVARLKNKLDSSYEYRFINKDGSVSWVLGKITSIKYKGKKAALGSFMDITERKKVEDENELKANLLDDVSDSLIVSDLDGNIIYVNEVATYTHKLSKEELLNTNIRQIVPRHVNEISKEKIIKGGEFRFEMPGFRKDGTNGILEIHTRVIDIDGRKLVIGTGRDITERKRTQEQFEYMATHDMLTGLPNRVLLNDRLDLALVLAKRRKNQLAVMMLDLDNFKDINDTQGHVIGDELLKAIGNTLPRLLRTSDSVARIGGDEYLILLPEINSKDDAISVAEKILDTFKAPFVVNNIPLSITTSIGIAVYPEYGGDSESLIKNADAALYLAKEKGGNSCEIFNNFGLSPVVRVNGAPHQFTG
jgi:diguanylate cyclase (GGDEF)-like protein/PAS domain S-box-containing protein